MSAAQMSPRSTSRTPPPSTQSAGTPPLGGPLPGLPEAPINILIVDDEPKNLVVLETVLDDPSYRLVRARSANEALLSLIAEDYALLILDVRMPDMSGFELAEMIKQRKKTAQVPIIFLTAYYNEDQHVLEGYGSGAVDYLHKPVNPAVLRSKVAIFADLYRKSRQLAIANCSLLLEVTERRHAQAQLRELNETLEQRVAERTEALRKSEAALLEASDKKDKFIAILAHELRNPLAPIRNAVNVIHTMGEMEPALAWCRDVIDRQVRQMTHLLEDLLDVSRITRTKLALRLEAVELKSVIEQAIETAHPFIVDGGHKLNLQLPSGAIVLQGDLTRLAQVVSNLLINAAKYSQHQSEITLAAEHGEGYVVVKVKDDGIGIAAEHLPHIFEMFGQVESALTRSQGGLGIGLALSKALVEMHNGTLHARSEGSGRGSEFVVRLPVSEVHAAPELRLLKSKEPARNKAKYRILIADDMRDNADSLALLLQAMGNEVAAVYGGEEALEKIETFAPDLVFLDLGMPEVDGYETCRRIRAQACGCNVVLVALTGWGEKNYRLRTNEAGFDHHFVKPLDTEKLERLFETLGAPNGGKTEF
jgi:signal transduction histidine kinase